MATKSKSTSTSGPSVDDIVELYEGHGKVFENVFSGDAELIGAFLAWGKSAFPRWSDEVDQKYAKRSASTRAVLLETLIYDEENEAESVAPFFAQLPAPLRDRALAALTALGEGDGGDD